MKTILMTLLLVLQLAACGGGDFSGTQSACEPRSTSECTCPGYSNGGLRTCVDDGSGYGSCVCAGDYTKDCRPDTGASPDCGNLGLLTYICPSTYMSPKCQQTHSGVYCCRG